MSKSISMTDDELLQEILLYRDRIDNFEFDDRYGPFQMTPADEYMLGDMEEWLDRLEKAYKARGLILPARYPPDEEQNETEEQP